MWLVRPDLKPSANHPRSIVHDVKSQALIVPTVFDNTGTVIFDEQRPPAILCGQTDQDVARMTVLESIVH